MGIYSRLLSRLCDWAMRNPRMARLRREALSEVDGEILEIGFGTGLTWSTTLSKSVASQRLIPASGCHALPAEGSKGATLMWISGCRLPRNYRSRTGDSTAW